LQTLETMAILSRQGSKDVSPLVTSLVSGGDRIADSVFVIDRFLRRHFVYREEYDEVLRDVPFMLHDLSTLGHMEGDCDDMTILGSAMLCALGVGTRMTAIKSANPDEFDHVFSEARIGTEWIPVDPTVPYGTTYNQFGFMSEAVC
jgi:hypothetical protein